MNMNTDIDVDVKTVQLEETIHLPDFLFTKMKMIGKYDEEIELNFFHKARDYSGTLSVLIKYPNAPENMTHYSMEAINSVTYTSIFRHNLIVFSFVNGINKFNLYFIPESTKDRDYFPTLADELAQIHNFVSDHNMSEGRYLKE